MSADAQHRTRMLWLIGILHAFTHVYHAALMPLYLLMQRDFGFASVGQATSLVTVLMLSYFLPSYFLGVLADRVNRKKLLGFGLAINGLGFVLLSCAQNYVWAVAAVLVAGIGGSFYHPSATAMVARLFPTSKGKALGLVGIGASVGFFFGPLYTGWRAGMLETVVGAAAWRRPVLELGIAGILMAALFAWVGENEKTVGAAEQKAGRAEKMFPSLALWFFFLAAAFCFGLRDFAGAAMGSLGSLFLQNAHGYDTRFAGMALSGIFVASAISNPLFGRLSDHGRKRWTAVVLLIATVLVAIYPHVPTGWTIPLFLVFGFFFLASYPIVEAALMESVPDGVRGRVFGVFITVGGLVGNLSHWIIGHQVELMGEDAHRPSAYYTLYAIMAGLIVLSLIGLPCLHAIRKREHLDAPPGL